MNAITTEEANKMLSNASLKMVEEDNMVNVGEQDLQEVMFGLLEKVQVLAEMLAKSGNENAAWLAEELHKTTEEYDLRELAESQMEDWEKEYVPDFGRGELPDPDEAVAQGATVFGGDTEKELKS